MKIPKKTRIEMTSKIEENQNKIQKSQKINPKIEMTSKIEENLKNRRNSQKSKKFSSHVFLRILNFLRFFFEFFMDFELSSIFGLIFFDFWIFLGFFWIFFDF